MRTYRCTSCQRLTGFKRSITAATALMFFVTGGAWLIVWLFYPLRCKICGMKESKLRQSGYSFELAIVAAFVLALLVIFWRV